MKIKRLIIIAFVLVSLASCSSFLKDTQKGLVSMQISVSVLQPKLQEAHDSGLIVGAKWNEIVDLNNKFVDSIKRAWRLYWLFDQYAQPEVQKLLLAEFAVSEELLVKIRHIAVEFGVEVQ